MIDDSKSRSLIRGDRVAKRWPFDFLAVCPRPVLCSFSRKDIDFDANYCCSSLKSYNS